MSGLPKKTLEQGMPHQPRETSAIAQRMRALHKGASGVKDSVGKNSLAKNSLGKPAARRKQGLNNAKGSLRRLGGQYYLR